MNKSYLTVLLITFCLSLPQMGWSQENTVNNPGYLGRTTSVTYSFLFFPALGLENDFEGRLNRKPGLIRPDGSLFFNTNHRLTFDQTISTQASFGLAFEYILTGDSRDLGDSVQHYLINATGAGIQFKFFPFRRKGAIAPNGPYTRVDFKFYSSQLKYGDPEDVNYNEKITTRISTALSLEFGINNVFWDFLLLDVGVRYSLSSMNLIDRGDFEKNLISYRLFSHDLMKINLGIGYLF